MEVAIQLCVFLIMAVVGLDLTWADFKRLAEHPAVVFVASVAQWLLLPVAAWAVAWMLPLPPSAVAGMILLAACPAGAISNYYALVARTDVALSVTLTPISTVAAVISMPVISSVGFNLLLDEGARVDAPIVPMAVQLILNLLLPVVLGMWFRTRFSRFVERHQTSARRLGDVAMVATVAFLLVGLGRYVVAGLLMTILATILFTILAAASGLIVAATLRADRRQSGTLAIEFACRNNAIIALIGLVVLDRPDLAAFGLVVFLTQVPFVLGGIVLMKKGGGLEA